jgi:hypothetical protein
MLWHQIQKVLQFAIYVARRHGAVISLAIKTVSKHVARQRGPSVSIREFEEALRHLDTTGSREKLDLILRKIKSS